MAKKDKQKQNSKGHSGSWIHKLTERPISRFNHIIPGMCKQVPIFVTHFQCDFANPKCWYFQQGQCATRIWGFPFEEWTVDTKSQNIKTNFFSNCMMHVCDNFVVIWYMCGGEAQSFTWQSPKCICHSLPGLAISRVSLIALHCIAIAMLWTKSPPRSVEE